MEFHHSTRTLHLHFENNRNLPNFALYLNDKHKQNLLIVNL